MPPKPNPSLYSVSKTFIWFFVASVILTASLAGIVWIDYDRSWKKYQKEFVQLKIKKSKADLAEAVGKVDKALLTDLENQLKAAKDLQNQSRAQIEKTKTEIEKLNTQAIKKKDDYQNAKQFQDSYRYFYEEYTRHHDKRAVGYQKRLASIGPKVNSAKLANEAAEKAKADKEAELQSFYQKEKDIQRQIDKVLEEQNRAQGKIDRLKPSLAKDVLNAPMLDFVAPSLKVQQIVLDNLYDDYHFAKTQKVDRCTTCHLGIDQKGFEDAPQPFRTHPNLDLYLGSTSPHQIEKFGCTTCHSGSGHSVSFTNAAHTPQNEDQAKEWKKKYDWKPLEKWDSKMLPLQYTQAACAKCHTNTFEVPKADKLNEGRRLANTYGCFNCHKIDGHQERWKVGPDLEHVSGKVSKDWLVKWLHDPRSFREATKMPSVFHLSNTSSPEDKARNAASIEGISQYLIKNSTKPELVPMTATGNAENGAKLAKERGCMGCHSLPGGVGGDEYGPELSGLGSKVTPEWLYNWVKDPKHVSKNTRMPNLRLSEQEAADIVAYLLSFKNESFDSKSAPQADAAVRDELILESMQGTLRKTEADAELAKMSEEDRWLYLGKKSIAHQGCFTCHSVKGFDEAKPIGAELTYEGSKDIHQFDFGFVHTEHTRQAFIKQKLKNPRIFDEGKIKSYYDKLRMPQFHFTDEQIDALTTFILSQTKETVPMEMKKNLDLKEQKIERGRYLAAKLNCAGCHTLDGREGTLRKLVEDKGQAPPILDGEGAKVQEQWLHAFLKEPQTIRSWINTRMPTFGFTDADTEALVAYFAYLSDQEISYQGHPAPATSKDKLEAGKALFDQLQCAKCHQVTAETLAMGSSFLAPDLKLAKDRLKPEWTHKWILDPQSIDPGTMMPGFFPEGQSPIEGVLGGDANAQISAIRDYLYTYEDGGNSSKSS